jgi:signal transduction histidine kinase
MSRAGGLPDESAGPEVRLLVDVLEAMPDAVAVLDAEGRIEVANSAMRELCPQFGDEALRLNAAGQGAPVTDEIGLPGGEREFARYVAPLGAPEGAARALVILREVTGERGAARLQDELFGLVSHELRTPLASIIGYLDLAREGVFGEERGYLDVVDRNARRLLRLVDDLLFSAQVEAGQMPLALGQFDLLYALQEAVEAARPRASARGIRLALAAGGSTLCAGDRDRVSQVIDNLITNALKFTPPGGQVALRLATTEGEATIEISDSGPGVPVDEQAKLFERFYRAPNAVEQAVPGLGLGLSIVKAIVDAHGGRIGVRGNDAGGATFVLALPRTGVVREDAQLASGRSSRDSAEPDPPTRCESASGRGR